MFSVMKEKKSLQPELEVARRSLNSEVNCSSAVRSRITDIIYAFQDYIRTDNLSVAELFYTELYDAIDIHPDHISAKDLLDQSIRNVEKALEMGDDN